MSDALDRRDRLAAYSGERGSMVLVTERRQSFGAIRCEVCNEPHIGGLARGVVLEEPGAGAWLLWVSPDGWSLAEHSDVAVCPVHQKDPLLRILRFSE
jgi:hypothetical protein